MLETWIHYGVIYYAFGVLVLIGLIAKIISGITVRKMVKEAAEIQKSNHKLMRLIKAKFEHASMVSDRVLNVEVFAKKYLYEYRVLGCRASSWQSLPKKMIWLSLLVGVLGTFGAYWVDGTGDTTIRHGAVTIITMTAIWTIHNFGNETVNREAAKNYIVDYLENVCIHRYEKANQLLDEEVQAQEEETKKMEEIEEVTIPEISEKLAETVQQEDEQEREKEQEKRIRAILQEFLA